MASIGLRKPYFARYNYDPETGRASYTGGGLLGKAIEFATTYESGGSDPLYADDGEAETFKSFAGGTVTITTDDLTLEASSAVLGSALRELTLGNGEEKYQELVFDDDMNSPYLGIGVIIPRQKSGVRSYRAVILLRTMFAVPEDAATTQGKSIEWKTPTITGDILRSDAEKRPWKRTAEFPSEALAVTYIKQVLEIIDEATPAALEDKK